MAHSDDVALPTSIGRYQIRSLIGRGGMGVVYGAFDPSLDRNVALKTIRTGDHESRLVDRLHVEARAIGRLRHPGIVTIHDLGESAGQLFIAMELLEGRSLADALTDSELTFSLKLKVLADVLDALAYAHGQGVIHRDIKPSNVWVEPDWRVKLLDFGLARFTMSEGLTLSGDVMGTPHYMSPEQLKGRPVDGRTDVFSTGIMGYELLARRRPFQGESITAIIVKVLDEEAPPIGTAWSAAFPEIEAIIARAMSKSPADRFATAGEMADAIRRFSSTHQDQIARVDDEVRSSIATAISEAEAMRAQGQSMEATIRLTAALAANPDSTTVRDLLGQETEVIPPAPRVPDRWIEPTRAPAPPVPGETRPVSPPRQAQHTRPSSRLALIGIAGLVVAGIVWGAYALSPTKEAGGAPDSGTSAPETAPAPPPDAAPVPAAVPSDVSAVSPPVTVGDQVPSGAGRAVQPGPRASVPPPAVLSGFSLKEMTSPTMRALVVQQLTDAGLAPSNSSGQSRWVLTITSEVDIRSAPVGGGDALTADYVGQVELVDRRLQRTEVRSFEGHVLDFGRAVVRSRAERELAVKISAHVTSTIKSWQ